MNTLTKSIMSIAGCNEIIAERVTQFYVKNKLVTRDVHGGDLYSVKHGVFLDLPVLQKAIELTR